MVAEVPIFKPSDLDAVFVLDICEIVIFSVDVWAILLNYWLLALVYHFVGVLAREEMVFTADVDVKVAWNAFPGLLIRLGECGGLFGTIISEVIKERNPGTAQGKQNDAQGNTSTSAYLMAPVSLLQCSL